MLSSFCAISVESTFFFLRVLDKSSKVPYYVFGLFDWDNLVNLKMASSNEVHKLLCVALPVKNLVFNARNQFEFCAQDLQLVPLRCKILEFWHEPQEINFFSKNFAVLQ